MLSGENMQITMNVEQNIPKGKTVRMTRTFLEPNTYLAGRSKYVCFSLGKEDPAISRRHFMLEISPSRCYIRDFGSMNGTVVNGVRIREAELQNGDVIKIGEYTAISVQITETDDENSETKPLDDDEEKTLNLGVHRIRGTTIPSLCFYCKKDISERANSDGRSEELNGIALYVCDNCAEKRTILLNSSEIDEYLLLRELGTGGIGIVYEAIHKPTGRLVALKKIRSEKVNEKNRLRFIRGMRLAEQITHPNIVRLLEQGIYQGANYVVSEYLPGGDVKQVITNRILPPKLLCQIIIDILKGLEYLHKKDILHRAVKPGNILLSKSGGRDFGTVKLSDFGLSKSYSDAGGSVITDPEEVTGKIIYMAPEQLIDFRNTPVSADIYSAGISLYELLTGKLPFNPQPKDVVLIVLEDDPIPVQVRNPSIPKVLADIVDRSIQKDSKDRFESATEFRKEIEHVVKKLK